MKYQQLTLEERLLISHLLRQGFNLAEIGRQMGPTAAPSGVSSSGTPVTATIQATATPEPIAKQWLGRADPGATATTENGTSL